MGLDHPVVIVVLTLVGVLVLFFLLLLIVSGGNTQRISLALRAFGQVLGDATTAEKVQPLLERGPRKPTAPPKPSGAPLRLLRLLQRDGRFIDFVLENIQPFDDSQIAAAVREMQPHWQATLQEHLVLEPIRTETEGSTVEVPAGFDPSAVQVTGNVTGQPPFRGTLKHPGWRVRELKLAPPPEGQDEFVLQPAEVELP